MQEIENPEPNQPNEPEIDIKIFPSEGSEGSETYESCAPKDLTEAIIKEAGVPENLPAGISSVMEDFVVQKIDQGERNEETIIDSFFSEGTPQKIEERLEEARQKAEMADWQEIFSEEDEARIKSVLAEEMRDMGISEEQIDKMRHIVVNIHSGLGISTVGEESVEISRMQFVCKAIDCENAYQGEMTFAEVLRALMIDAVAHELGHKIDSWSRISSKIPSEWYYRGNPVDDKKERFAEYWGRLALDSKQNQIVQKAWALETARVRQTWQVAAEAKISLGRIFDDIRRKLRDQNNSLSLMIFSRQCIYSSKTPENFARPYSKKQIEDALKQTKV